MHQFLSIQDMTRQQKLTYAVMSLTGSAQIWWNAQEDNGLAPTTWTGLKKAIEYKFQTVNEAKHAAQKIYQIRQIRSV